LIQEGEKTPFIFFAGSKKTLNILVIAMGVAVLYNGKRSVRDNRTTGGFA